MMTATSKTPWYRRKRTLAVFVLLINTAGLIYLLAPRPFVAPPFEIGGTIEVVVSDEQDNRIAGASVTPHGLRAVQDQGSWYSWQEKEHGPYESVVTNEDGLAELKYPKWVSRDNALVISTLCMMVTHPDYCPNLEVECPTALVGSVKPVHRIQLKKGGRLRARLRREGSDEPFGEVYGRSSGAWMEESWKKEQPGTILSPTHLPGNVVTRIIDRTDPKNLRFSDPILFNSVAGKTEEVDVVIRPGVRFRGKLDVPTAVKDGYVILRVTDFSTPTPTRHDDGLVWTVWTKVAESGEFEFPSLPPTSLVSLHAWCDGFVSSLPKPASIPGYALPVASSHVLPQFHELKGESELHVIPMEASASCDATVTDSLGRPLEGIKIEFYPNILVGLSGNTLTKMAHASDHEMPKADMPIADRLREQMRQYGPQGADTPGYLSIPSEATSDAKGNCVIANLAAAGGHTLYVSDEKWVLKGLEVPPFRSKLNPTLTSGEVTKVDVVVVPKPALTRRMLKPPEPNAAEKLLTQIKSFLGL